MKCIICSWQVRGVQSLFLRLKAMKKKSWSWCWTGLLKDFCQQDLMDLYLLVCLFLILSYFLYKAPYFIFLPPSSWCQRCFLKTSNLFNVLCFLPLKDSSPHGQSSDSTLSDVPPPAKRKYVLKNKGNVPAIIYNKGECYFFVLYL